MAHKMDDKEMSNDLISRSELMEFAEYDVNFRLVIPYEKVKKAQTVYDLEKVCEELERLKNADIDMSDEEPELMDAEELYDEGRAQGRVEAYVKAIEVVRNGGKKE